MSLEFRIFVSGLTGKGFRGVNSRVAQRYVNLMLKWI